jgi:hypothetical protein
MKIEYYCVEMKASESDRGVWVGRLTVWEIKPKYENEKRDLYLEDNILLIDDSIETLTIRFCREMNSLKTDRA